MTNGQPSIRGTSDPRSRSLSLEVMNKRISVLVSVALAPLTIGIPARAAETGASRGGEAAAEHQVPRKAAAEPAPPRPAPADPYRCQPSQDISCTVVRETAQGTLIVSMRRGGPGARLPEWVVISGAPPLQGRHPGGTVYVVPNDAAEVQPLDHQADVTSPNGAPILE